MTAIGSGSLVLALKRRRLRNSFLIHRTPSISRARRTAEKIVRHSRPSLRSNSLTVSCRSSAPRFLDLELVLVCSIDYCDVLGRWRT